MKFTLAFAFMSILSTNAFAVEVHSVRLDANQENLLIDVSYGGGCVKPHKFELKMGGCFESMPVQCNAQLIDRTTGDFCEAIVSDTAVINLKKVGITGGYYENGSLTIKGDRKSVSVQLPGPNGQKPPRTIDDLPTPQVPGRGAKKTVCVTNTGSDLEINAAGTKVTIETADGRESSYSVVSKRAIVLESMPPIDQTTYALNDGRKVVIEFRGDEKVGTGYYIRIGGEASPEFKSCMMVK